jgi:hypothetical protein
VGLFEPGVVAHTYNPSTWERKEDFKFKASPGCIARPCFKTAKTKGKQWLCLNYIAQFIISTDATRSSIPMTTSYLEPSPKHQPSSPHPYWIPTPVCAFKPYPHPTLCCPPTIKASPQLCLALHLEPVPNQQVLWVYAASFSPNPFMFYQVSLSWEHFFFI